MSFKCQLKNYKPKNSGLELGILKTKDERKISSFQDALRQQNLSKLAKDQRIQARKEYEAEIHKQEQILERNQIEMKAKEVENEKKLEECPKDSEVRMSKKRKRQDHRNVVGMWPWMHSGSKRTGAMQGPGTHTIYPRTGTVHWSSSGPCRRPPHAHVPYLSCVRYKLVLSSIWTNSRVANRMAIFDLIRNDLHAPCMYIRGPGLP